MSRIGQYVNKFAHAYMAGEFDPGRVMLEHTPDGTWIVYLDDAVTGVLHNATAETNVQEWAAGVIAEEKLRVLSWTEVRAGQYWSAKTAEVQP